MLRHTLTAKERRQLRKARVDEGITVGELAVALGVGERSVARWESGDSSPSPLAFERLSKRYPAIFGKDADPHPKAAP